MHFAFSSNVAKDSFFIVLTILIAVILSSILTSFIKLPKGLENRRGQTYVSIIKSTITIIIYAIALHVIFGILHINLAPLLASAGIIALSIGMGARSFIEDLIAGMTLLSQDSIAIGDEVMIDESRGNIERIGFRTLYIRAKDGSLHIIPNGMVKKVINYSRKPRKEPAHI